MSNHVDGGDDGGDVHASPRLDDAVAFRIHRANRLLLTHLARFLETSARGLTPEAWFVLARIHTDGPLRLVDLTEPALDDAPNVSRLVDRLVSAGWVERRPDPDDRRSKLVSVTPDGRRLAAELHERAIDERHRVFAGLDQAALTALTDALDRIEQNIRPALFERDRRPIPE